MTSYAFKFCMKAKSLLLSRGCLMTATTGAVIVRAVNGRAAGGAREEIGKGGADAKSFRRGTK